MSPADPEMRTRRRRLPGGMPQPESTSDLQVVPAAALAAVPDASPLSEEEALKAAVIAVPPHSSPAEAADGDGTASTLEAAAEVEAAAEPAAAEPSAPAAPPERPSRSRTRKPRRSADAEREAPARDERRDSRTFRIYRPLYDRLSWLVRDLEDEGFRTDRTELLHALMYLHLPDTPEGAQEMLRRFRMDQPD